MPLVRGQHAFESHYTQIPNAWLRDTRLSYKARGLLAELMTHAPGFKVSRQRLARNGQDGDRAIRTAIAELEAAGYLERSQGRTHDNRFSEAIWTTKDPSSPSVHFAPAGNAPADNSTPKKKEEEKTEEKKDLAQQVERDFDEFWSIYPRRVGKSAAKKAFAKVWSPDLDLVLAASRLANDPNLPPLQFIPHPATWLNRAGWEDEPYPERILTKEEREAKEAAEKVLRLERERRRREEAALERERERKEWEAARASVKLCEHNRVAVICPVCSK